MDQTQSLRTPVDAWYIFPALKHNSTFRRVIGVNLKDPFTPDHLVLRWYCVWRYQDQYCVFLEAVHLFVCGLFAFGNFWRFRRLLKCVRDRHDFSMQTVLRGGVSSGQGVVKGYFDIVFVLHLACVWSLPARIPSCFLSRALPLCHLPLGE